MEHSPAPRATTDKQDLLRIRPRPLPAALVIGDQAVAVLEQVEVHLDPGVLVAADDDARPVCVQEQDDGVGGRLQEQEVLDGQVQVRVCGPRDVHLDFVGGVGDGFCAEEAVGG